MYTIAIESTTPHTCGTYPSPEAALSTITGLLADYEESGCIVSGIVGVRYDAVRNGCKVATIRVVVVSSAVVKEVC